MTQDNSHSFYAVFNETSNEYFGGFNPDAGKAEMVTSPLGAKLFSNKHDVKLRPDEKLVELIVALSDQNTTVSEPFRPRRREKKTC